MQSREGAYSSRATAPDVNMPNIARVYDYWLDGKDNFQADRDQAAQLLLVCPSAAQLARENRIFLARAVVWMAEQGIRQFLDVGSGLPTANNTHEAAQSVDPACRVVYVDNDPMVVIHAQVLLSGPGVAAASGDLAAPEEILALPAVRELIQPGEPVGLILGLVLHFFDAQVARQIVSSFTAWLPPGSYAAISVGTADQETGEELIREYRAARVHNHSPEQIARFFAGLNLVEPPGLADVGSWDPSAPAFTSSNRAGRILAGVGHKPHAKCVVPPTTSPCPPRGLTHPENRQ